MPARRFVLLVAAAVLVASPGVCQPPSEARLTIDGEAYNVPLGEEFAVRIAGERVTLRIDPQNDRLFDEAGVAFRYPSTFEAGQTDGGQDVRVWTLQGQSAAIMLQQYGADLDPDGLRDVMVENIAGQGADKPTPQKVKLTGAERAYMGAQVKTESGGKDGAPATETVQNVFTFANENGVFALMIQDVHAAGEGDSAEYSEALRLLGESLTTGRPPAPRRPAARNDESR
ncbi:hypothetical protein [Botrimarina sp.]|uniref:hypothetical protein n=1 Tax=Botrimarina sp. TaxID=2795802 RepID=UPI0032EE17E3